MSDNVIRFPSKNNESMIVTLGGGFVKEDDGTYTAMVTFGGLRSKEEAEAVFEKMFNIIKSDFESVGIYPLESEENNPDD